MTHPSAVIFSFIVTLRPVLTFRGTQEYKQDVAQKRLRDKEFKKYNILSRRVLTIVYKPNLASLNNLMLQL